MNNQENKKVKKGIISTKIYFDRARMYLGYINFFMLNLVLLNSSENGFIANMVNQNPKLGFRQEEMRNNAIHNPVLMEMIDSINEIKKEIKKDQTSD
jgi:hypothetical protein